MREHWCITPKGSLAGSRKRVERFRGGTLSVGLGAFDVSDGIRWDANPFGTRMWGFRFHNLQWLYDFYRVASESGEDSAASDANAVIQDWIDHNHPPPGQSEMAWDAHVTALRARVLLCSVMAFGGPFHEVLADHARVISEAAGSEPAWNHGTDQLITLLTIGCALEDRELIDIALGRLSQTLPVIIDEQGVSNEQSPTYDYYVWSQIEELAGLMEDCGLPVLPLLQRRQKTPIFLAHATRPDGRWAHLGDTIPRRVFSIEGTPLEYAVSMGDTGTPPEERVAVFDRGYVFGRSGWGSERSFGEEAWYSIRFGPGRRIHGHRDHTSVTWYAYGRPILVDSGFSGYDEGEFRDYERSEFAHTQVVVRGAGEFNPDAPTSLKRHRIGDGWEAYGLEDQPYENAKRRREILVRHDPPLMVLRDDVKARLGSQVEATSLLHLPADASEIEIAADGYVAELAAEETLTLQVLVLGASRFQIYRGWEGTGGWIGDGLLDRSPAPVLASSRSGRRVSITTVLVPNEADRPRVSQRGNRVVITAGTESAIIDYRRNSGFSLRIHTPR